MKKTLYLVLMTLALSGVADAQHNFAHDEAFIKSHDPQALVMGRGEARIIVSPKYQGKVFTSTFDGSEGKSLGWVNYKAFSGPLDPHMNAYGGENRLWLGPEGGPMSLYFTKGKKQEFANWHVPAAFDSEPWELQGTRLAGTEATLTKDMSLTNYAGQQFNLKVTRTIRLLEKHDMERLLHLQVVSSLKAVAYRTENTVTNTGKKTWNEKNGTFCTWMLDMFPPSDQTVIVVPFKPGEGKPAATDYFGEIAPKRLKIEKNVLFLKADGKSRGKLGIHPLRVKEFAGSYDAANHVLTIIQFDVSNRPAYLNQEWRLDKPLMSGDAMNAYNDGPLATGGQLGPFYELESVSTAHFCAPGNSSTHWHTVYHFSGSEAQLDYISKNLLGVTIPQIKQAFK